MYVCIYVCTDTCLYVCTIYTCMYYTCMYVCMYMYHSHIHTHIDRLNTNSASITKEERLHKHTNKCTIPHTVPTLSCTDAAMAALSWQETGPASSKLLPSLPLRQTLQRVGSLLKALHGTCPLNQDQVGVTHGWEKGRTLTLTVWCLDLQMQSTCTYVCTYVYTHESTAITTYILHACHHYKACPAHTHAN